MNHCGSSWRLRGTTRSCGGLPGTVKAYLGALEANPGAEEDDHGAVEAYPVAVNAHMIQYVHIQYTYESYTRQVWHEGHRFQPR